MQTDTPIQNKEIRQTYQLVICYREAFPEKTEGDYSFVYKTEISTFDLNGKNAKTDPLKTEENDPWKTVQTDHRKVAGIDHLKTLHLVRPRITDGIIDKPFL